MTWKVKLLVFEEKNPGKTSQTIRKSPFFKKVNSNNPQIEHETICLLGNHIINQSDPMEFFSNSLTQNLIQSAKDEPEDTNIAQG